MGEAIGADSAVCASDSGVLSPGADGEEADGEEADGRGTAELWR